ncbi:uncharacterized protein LOC113214461 [Frankliniella occidentalis]|uniref:Uncharacterized protein LOC113214461 n=1 Tax=Frankliniella occidentalis TaxID=133901 RepID=A0A6J1TD28_FRAOC|nr:uncharacterized protein LOC113214461 [Frankliniella occidentalis]
MAVRDDWLRSHREPRVRNLLAVTDTLRSGRGQPGPEELSGALLEAMRTNNVKQLQEVLSKVKDYQLLEDSLTAAWCKARAQGLPLSKDMEQCAVYYMVLLRYELSPRSRRKDKPRPLGWDALWGLVGLVDQLRADVRRLLDLLKLEEADEAVTLAMRSALAIRAVKGFFYRSYGEVPWEEIEYLLALFIEARTVYRTLAFLVASKDRITAHLEFFLEKVEELRTKHTGRSDTNAAMKEMMKAPKGKRAEKTTSKAVGKQMADILEDFALLRDWQSLKVIVEALEAAIAALQLPGEDWKNWGWLGFQRGLFLAGEKMKNSWTSPNLSSRYVKLVEVVAAEGIRKVLCNGIRDVQEHSAPGSNADELTMSVLDTDEERTHLKEELGRLLHSIKTMLQEAELEVTQKRMDPPEIIHNRLTERVVASIGNADMTSDRNWVYGEVKRLLEDVNKGKNNSELEALIRDLNHSLHRKLVTFNRFSNTLTRSIKDRMYNVVTRHCPQHIQRIHQLLEWRSAQGLSIFQDDLNNKSSNAGGGSCGSSSRACSALEAIPSGREDNESLIRHAVEGGLQALASRWHRDDHAPPLLDLHAPALFGRQLRNHLNHRDLIVRLCSPTTRELSSLWSLLLYKAIDVERGAEPRLRDPTESAAENAEVLRLARLKDAMFRGAREGDLDELQRAAGLGVDISRRDCLGVDISSRDCRGRTLLHAAAEAGQARVVDWLLQLGAGAVDPLATDWEGRSALHGAATAEVAESLIAAGRVAPDGYGWTPLHAAALSGRTAVVRALLPHYDLHAKDNAGGTPLHLAAGGGHAEAVRLLLLVGARWEAVQQNEQCSTLSIAAQSGSAAVVRLLLLPPPPLLPRPSDYDCWIAAVLAGQYRHLEVFSTLMDELQRRSALRDSPEARLAVGAVAIGGSTEVAAELLNRWPDAVRLGLDEAVTVLSVAAGCGHADLVRTLLSRGADPLQRGKDSCTALHHAAQVGSVEVIDVLWEHKQAEQDAARGEELRRVWEGRREGGPRPPLGLAARGGHLAAVRRLVELGADKDSGVRDAAHYTPLYAAARHGREEVVSWLLGARARLYDPEAAHTPLHVAAMFGHLAVVKLLVPSRELTEQQQRERLGLLQHAGPDPETALHCAVVSGSLEVVKHLLEREVTLLDPHYNRRVKEGKSALWKNLTVYRRDSKKRTPLQWCVVCDAPTTVFRELLQRMEDERVMALGGKDVLAVRDMVQEALDWVDPVHLVQTVEYGRPPHSEGMRRELTESLRRLDTQPA